MVSTSSRRYRSLAQHWHERFGAKVYRVTVDAGFTCPNVDGTVAVGGCVFCDNRSFSPNRRLPIVVSPPSQGAGRGGIREQVERGINTLSARFGAEKFLAYFQAATNTYAPVDKLRRLYDEALQHPRVLGLAIGTRPDCVPDDVLDLLEKYARTHYVLVELGLQSIHDRSLDWMNRGHHYDAFADAIRRCQGRPLELCIHVILGLPGESRGDMLATADALASAPIHGVKLHNLHVVKDTPLEKWYRAGEVRMMELDEYVGIACDFLERLPPEIVIHRLNGDAPPDYLVAPTWCLDKPAILRAIDAEFERRGSRQGSLYAKPAGEPCEPAGSP